MNSEHSGAGVRGALSLVLLGEFDAREDGLERWQGNGVAQNDPYGIKAPIKAMEELDGEVDLDDGVVDVELKVVGIGVWGRGVLDEVGEAMADEDHEEEGLPFVKVVFVGVEEEFDVVRHMIVEHGVASWRRRWWWW